MLLVPISGKISLRNPPVITIVLIIINCIVFFVFQFNENQIYWEAEEYYRESGLLDLEIDAYLKYRYCGSTTGPCQSRPVFQVFS